MVEDRRTHWNGLDVGTVNLVAAERNGSGQLVLRLRRNSFIEVPADGPARDLVARLKAPHIVHGRKMFVLGDHAFKVAAAVDGAARPAISTGMKALLGRIAETPAGSEDCYSSISADHAPAAVIKHGSLFEAFLHALNCKPSHIVEGHSVPFARPAEESFAGMGIFCGGGHFDLCIAYKSLPAVFFSNSRGGEWVDIQAATDLGVKAASPNGGPRANGSVASGNGEENEIAGYYRNLINHTLSNIKEQLEPAGSPVLPDPISIVFSGATSTTGNFIELVRTVYKEADVPMKKKEEDRVPNRPASPAPPPQSVKAEAPAPEISSTAMNRLAALRNLSIPKKTATPAQETPSNSLAMARKAAPPAKPAAPVKAAPPPQEGSSSGEEEPIEDLDDVIEAQPAPDEEGLYGSPERRIVDFRRYLPAAGRGLDVGTSNVVGAVRAFTGASPCNIQRNAFLDVRSDVFTEKLLMKLGVDQCNFGNKRFVIGNPAFEFANIFEKSTRRPMKNGHMSSSEPDAIYVEGLVIRSVLGKAPSEGEICTYSVQADPIDVERNGVYHAGAIETILKSLGYSPRPLLEGMAVIYAELAAEDYTGIGISCGGGSFNICIAYKSLPALAFSISRGGDWIDANVAQSLGLPTSHVCAIKESGIDLNDPKGRIEEAICIYYRNLIHYSIETIRERFESASNMPTFREPISVVCSGGTSMIKGFIDVFRQEFETINFPIPVREIRRAKDPMRTVARGCLEAALEETRARDAAPAPGPKLERADISTVSKAPARPAPPAAAAKTDVPQDGNSLSSPWWKVVKRTPPLQGPSFA